MSSSPNLSDKSYPLITNCDEFGYYIPTLFSQSKTVHPRLPKTLFGGQAEPACLCLADRSKGW